jgi:Holliday junction resolvase RusA-like endonuclease
MPISFFVPGIPQPQGSMRAVGTSRAGHAILTSDNPKLHTWREMIGWSAREVTTELIEGPVTVSAVFHLPRPKSTPAYVIYPGKKPDIDKLVRGCLDALTGVVLKDDALVVTVAASKRYAEPGQQPGVAVTVTPLANDRRVAS